MSHKIHRLQDVLSRLCISRSNLYLQIQQGLFTPPIKLGKRAVGWIQSEIDAILLARISGFSEEQIKSLVINLESSRGHHGIE